MLPMVMTAAAMLILTVMMVMLLFHLCQIHSNLCLSFHCLHQLGAGKLVPGCGDNGSLCIMLPEHCNSRIQLLLGNAVSTGQDDGGGGFNLVVIELSKVLHIHLYLASIHHGNSAIQGNILICDLLHSGNHIGQLANTGGFNHNTVGVVLTDNLGQSLTEIAHQAAADTAGVHLGDVNAGILQKSTVNADLAKFVFNQHQLLACVGLRYHFLNQCGLAGTQKAGINIDFCHFLHTFLQNSALFQSGHFLIK